MKRFSSLLRRAAAWLDRPSPPEHYPSGPARLNPQYWKPGFWQAELKEGQFAWRDNPLQLVVRPPGCENPVTFIINHKDRNWDGNREKPTIPEIITVGVGSDGQQTPAWKGHLTAGQWVGADLGNRS